MCMRVCGRGRPGDVVLAPPQRHLMETVRQRCHQSDRGECPALTLYSYYGIEMVMTRPMQGMRTYIIDIYSQTVTRTDTNRLHALEMQTRTCQRSDWRTCMHAWRHARASHSGRVVQTRRERQSHHTNSLRRHSLRGSFLLLITHSVLACTGRAAANHYVDWFLAVVPASRGAYGHVHGDVQRCRRSDCKGDWPRVLAQARDKGYVCSGAQAKVFRHPLTLIFVIP